MELHDRAVSPWPIPPARAPLEIEASFLDSDVRGLLGTEELAGDEPACGPQLQWATHTEFPTIVKLLELNCCAISLTAADGGGVFAVLTNVVAGLDLETQGSEVVVPLADGPSRIAHPSGSCAVVFIIEIPVLTRRTAAANTVAGPTCCMAREIQRRRRRLFIISSWTCGRRTREF